MSPRPAIFVSAVSSELRSARQLVANALTFLGYDPEWQEIFGTEQGDLRSMLRRRIDSCKGVVQLVGQCYGAEPPNIDERFGRVSYTQYEALYATSKGNKVWYLLLEEGFPSDPHDAEDEEKRKLQADYRARVKAESHLYYTLSSEENLELSVLRLRERQRILGPEHKDTLACSNELANSLYFQGKYAEAEAAYPDTLTTRSNLADVLAQQGKNADAEAEDREIIKLREKVLGPEHPATLGVRYSLATVLAGEGRYSEAETEYRTVLRLQEKVLPVDHPDTHRTCFNLASCLRAEREISAAAAFAKRAADGALKILGEDHPDTKKYEQLRQELQPASAANTQ